MSFDVLGRCARRDRRMGNEVETVCGIAKYVLVLWSKDLLAF
jgi:hypothetical protein